MMCQELFGAIGDRYAVFGQVSDEEVIDIPARLPSAGSGPAPSRVA